MIDTMIPTVQTRVDRGIEVNPFSRNDKSQRWLTPQLLALIEELHRDFEPQRQLLLRQREERQSAFDQGALPDYDRSHVEALNPGWRVAPVPPDLRKRRVEITGPVNNPKMVINMLSRNSEGHRADTAMLDFEDSMKPTWTNVIDGITNLAGAVNLTLEYQENDKSYRLNPQDMAVIMTRVRGLHLNESNVTVDGAPVSAGLFDFVVTFYHSARIQVAKGRTPIYYIPKTEHYLEARWWNDLFIRVQKALHLPVGTMRATFLIETLPAAFQMEEILYEFRQHAAGLNVGRWDKIFSDIKVLREHPDRVLADRGNINLEKPWMMNYAKRLIKICHRRGAYAMGGMSAFTPGRTPEARMEQTEKVKTDKVLESSMGHDGCWVSHPYFIGHAMAAFTKDHQLDVMLNDFDLYPDLLPISEGPKTMAGLRKNLRVGIAYIRGWNDDIGCVAWDGLMEDLATLEISRAQVWQWLRHRISLNDGTVVNDALIRRVFDEELLRIETEIKEELSSRSESLNDETEKFRQARIAAEEIFLHQEFRNFLATKSELAR